MDLLILLAATPLCGAADALGFVHAARVWPAGGLVAPRGLGPPC